MLTRTREEDVNTYKPPMRCSECQTILYRIESNSGVWFRCSHCEIYYQMKHKPRITTRKLIDMAMYWLHNEIGVNHWKDITDQGIMKAINKNYPGGWSEFLEDKA